MLRGWLAAGILLTTLLAGAWGVARFYPFELVVASRRVGLWRGGARRVRAATLMAYERDRCEGGAPCRCIGLIHGLGDSAMTWDKLLLDPKVAAPGTRLMAVELPGSEGSQAPADYRVPTMARAVRAALESRCPSWTIAGNSLGGWVTLQLALDWPQGVDALVLVDAAGIDEPTGVTEANARALADPTVDKLKAFRRLARHNDREIPERVWPSAVAAIEGRPTKKIVEALGRDQLLDARLPSLRVPVTILWGESDRIIPVDVGVRMHRGIRGSRLVRIPGCGHLPQQECPETVAAAILARRKS